MTSSSSIQFMTYQGTGTIGIGTGIPAINNVTGVILLGTPHYVNFTVTNAVTASNVEQTVTFAAQIPFESNANPNPQASVSVWVPPAPFASVPYTQYVFSNMILTEITALATPTTTADRPKSTTGRANVTVTTSASDSTSSSMSTLLSDATPTNTPSRNLQRSYSPGTLAGVSIACIFGGMLVAALIFFLFYRRRSSNGNRNRNRNFEESEKQMKLLEGHGEAVYVAGNEAWAKHLPQAEADSTIRGMMSRTLDQIAMHVENFYTAKNKIVLSTEHQFELENVDSSHLPVPTSTLLQQSRRPEQIIKHCIASYIVSMITFDNSNASGSFLPKAFRRQWQPSGANIPGAQMQAYSRWRVLTAYLRQSDEDEQAYLTERNAMIDTAARHICKAFGPWAKSEEEIRFQNMVGIMKRASELGMQLFSQPARFDWQWQPTTTSRLETTSSSTGQVAILSGLYKMTDQDARPLTTPLRLVEPVVVALEQL